MNSNLYARKMGDNARQIQPGPEPDLYCSRTDMREVQETSEASGCLCVGRVAVGVLGLRWRTLQESQSQLRVWRIRPPYAR